MRVVIADDDLLARQGITSLLREAGIEVAGILILSQHVEIGIGMRGVAYQRGASATPAAAGLPVKQRVAQDALRRRVQDQSRDGTDPTLVCLEQLG